MNFEQYSPKIHTIKGKSHGKVVAIFAGIHGNETAGVEVLKRLYDLKIERGTIYLVHANPQAIEKNIRYENQNLNRLFMPEKVISSYEDVLAKKLMQLLDSCDALLDLHAYPEPLGPGIPFAICEPHCFSVIKKMGLKFSVSGLSNLQKGSADQYMAMQNKLGICVELGSIEHPENFIELGEKISMIFLEHHGCISKTRILPLKKKTKHLIAEVFYKKKSQQFKLTQIFTGFDPVYKGQEIAQDGSEKIKAPSDGYILFARDNNVLDSESFLLTKEI